jgi:hypothetical protein
VLSILSTLAFAVLQSQLITVYPYQQTVMQPDVPPAFVAKLFPDMDLDSDQSQPVQLRVTVDGQHSTPPAAAAAAGELPQCC